MMVLVVIVCGGIIDKKGRGEKGEGEGEKTYVIISQSHVLIIKTIAKSNST